MDAIITLDSDDENDCLMEVNQDPQIEAGSSSSSGALIKENLSFGDFTPFSFPENDETDEEFDPNEEFDMDDLENVKVIERIERQSMPFYGLPKSSKMVYSYAKNDSVNQILNSLPNNFKVDKLKKLLPEDFVKQFGGIEAAYKEVVYYVIEERRKKKYEAMIECFLDMARKAGANEETIKYILDLPDEKNEITPEIKRELWDEILAQIETAPPDSKEGGDVVEENYGDDEILQSSPPITLESEIECIVIDDD
uniref:Uncharacterized protein n=2 Tax=Panagrolaimus sp. PS1159 TaxID=55785 RepID=A0AC35F8J0_9BILA